MESKRVPKYEVGWKLNHKLGFPVVIIKALEETTGEYVNEGNWLFGTSTWVVKNLGFGGNYLCRIFIGNNNPETQTFTEEELI